ncbi:MAG: hypothetical protein OHK0039_32870 [Bacteroidia bacterium]
MPPLSRQHITVEKRREYSGHTGSIYAMIASRDEACLYSGGDDGLLVRWDLTDDAAEGEALLRTERAIFALLDIPAHDLLVAGSSDGTVYFLDLGTRRLVHTFRKSTQSVFALYYDPGHDLLWVLQGKGGLSLLRPGTWEERGWLHLVEDHLRAAEPGPDGLCYVASSDRHILAIDRETLALRHRWEAHAHSVFCLRQHPAGTYLLSGGRDAYLRAWHPADHTPQQALPAHNFTVNDIAFDPSGGYFATASRDKTLKLWDARTFDLLKVVDFARNAGHTHSVNKIVWLKADNSLLSCGDDRRIIRWYFNIERYDNPT